MNFWYFLPHRCGIVLDKPKTFLIHFTIHGFVQFTLLKEHWNSPTRFSTPSFFHHSNWSGPLTNGLKYFRIWLSFRRDIQSLE